MIEVPLYAAGDLIKSPPHHQPSESERTVSGRARLGREQESLM